MLGVFISLEASPAKCPALWNLNIILFQVTKQDKKNDSKPFLHTLSTIEHKNTLKESYIF